MICRDCGREFEACGQQRLCPACAPRRTSKEPKTCPVCGKAFIPHIKTQTYCSARCRAIQRAAEQAKERYTVRCTVCGREFQAGYKHAHYCGAKCREQAAKERCSAAGPDREITGLTVYLVHKYAAEGMMEPEIAGILKRSAASVHEAIERPLKPYQQRCLQEFLKGR
ncbi:MAG: hypothetical protein HFG26_08975 [Provencibacterium sp.]|jgi:predicted nucleic acid-binding Zn ribbon protein|nr:hypothetical protein [Provencibacterium sp.]